MPRALQLFEQRALTSETGIGRGQPDADLARGWRDHLIPQPASTFADIGPGFIEDDDVLITAGGAGKVRESQ